MLYNDDSSLELVASMLLENKVGVIPADTIYGFSARANEITAGRIYEIKERPRNKSFIMLCGKDWLRQSRFIVPEELYDLWPCPLSVIVADREGHTQAVRVPQDKYILSLVRLTGPLWSTSCNISSMPSLTSYDEITAAFAGKPPQMRCNNLFACAVKTYLPRFALRFASASESSAGRRSPNCL